HRISPCLLYINEAHKSDYSGQFLPNDFSEISAEFENYLTNLLKEIFDSNTEFSATEHSTNCRYCDYLNLCGKKVFEF
ncbi:MAG: PD-(D/E)XK nuclease family protein, partial [Bacteroidales bacterium]|nr:PD-(D/E)XK nuclease family protein [Bacteroidales bacterium]